MSNEKKKRGPKPKLVLTKEDLEKIEALAGQGLTQEEIALTFGLRKTAWYNMITKNPEMRERIERGRARTLAAVSGKLMQLVNKGNLSAIIFYLKTKGRWSEHKSLELTGNDKAQEIKLKLDTTDAVKAAKVYQEIMNGG
jgi:hypothetical protein